MEKYTQAELTEAFERVESTFHWKDTINKVVELDPATAVEEIEKITLAVIHFTATVPKVIPQGGGRYRFVAAGYWAGPAA